MEVVVLWRASGSLIITHMKKRITHQTHLSHIPNIFAKNIHITYILYAGSRAGWFWCATRPLRKGRSASMASSDFVNQKMTVVTE